MVAMEDEGWEEKKGGALGSAESPDGLPAIPRPAAISGPRPSRHRDGMAARAAAAENHVTQSLPP